MEDDYSISTGVKKTFSVTDYVLFGLTLSISAGIGLFYAIKDRNKLSSKHFLLGERKMGVFPVTMSLMVTFISALTLLGHPAEMYNYTTMFWWLCLSFVLAMAVSARVFIPFFYNQHLTSVFQYLEMRFNKPVRVFVSVIFTVQTIIYMAFVLYAPSLALSAVSGLNLWAAVIAVGVVVTLYTTLGGMKAVLWTDTFQTAIIVAGLLAVLIQGSIVMGGFQNAWNIAYNRSRIIFDDFSFNPSTRHSFWSIVIGGGLFWTSLYGVNQSQVQRAISCPTVSKAQISLFANLTGLICIVSMCSMIGVVMFAFYADCHPLKFNGLISRTDQLVPLFVMDILGHLPGVPGIFVSCVFGGSLSTLSSGLNALSAVIPHDLIQPYCCKKISDRGLTILAKAMVIVFGVLTIAMAYVVSQLGNVLQAAYSFTSMTNGPMFGMFVLGMFFPWANAWGALVGGVVTLVFMCWIGFGAFVNRATQATLSPVYIHGCNWNITTTTMASTSVTPLNSFNVSTTMKSTGSSDPFYPMYTMSYLYYTPTAMVLHIMVGMVVTLITGKKDPATLDPRLICPLFDRCFPCLPECILRPLRCGIRHDENNKVTGEIKSLVQLVSIVKETDVKVDVTGVENTSKLNNPNLDQSGTVNPGFEPPDSFVTHL